MERVMELTAQKKILSMNPVGPGGIFVTPREMAAGNKIGAVITENTAGRFTVRRQEH